MPQQDMFFAVPEVKLPGNPPMSEAVLRETLKTEKIPEFMFRLNQIHIGRTRSPQTDTDTIAFTAKFGNEAPHTVTRSIGDVGTGNHQVDLVLGPFQPSQLSAPVVMGLQIFNKAGGDARLEDFLIQAGIDLVETALNEGGPWGQLASTLINLGDRLFPGLIHPGACDGYVAVGGSNWSSAEYLLRISQNVGGGWGFDSTFQGPDSMPGCGRNAIYTVNFGIVTKLKRVTEGSGHPD